MDRHALALLSNEALWKKVGLTKCEVNHPGFVTNLLLHLISESQGLEGSFLNEFWQDLGKCHPRLQENIGQLNAAPELISENDVSAMLFNGIPAAEFNISPIISLAGRYFTHLGLTFMKPRDTLGPTDADRYDETYDSGEDSDVDVDSCKVDDDELKLELDIQEEGLTDEQILKYSVFNRDGFRCVITGLPLEYPQRPDSGVRSSLIHRLNIERCRPYLAAIIPILIKESPSTLQCVESLAGHSTRQLVLSHLSTVNNVMVLEYNARFKFDQLLWTVEASNSPKYIYRRIPTVLGPGPLYIKLRDGSEIEFGRGQDGKRLGVGPLPRLCKLRLAVTRALRLSGAARLMARLIGDPTIDTSRDFRETAPSNYYLQIACLL
ncbi:hypothetical protein BYT27DRAFT_7197275 [Phlegmacium glaucopus]|nr:hypothetical protein BYT27DRAFT_7197275 [Phlegmacium glaucopus]